jgi:hypothetical protein
LDSADGSCGERTTAPLSVIVQIQTKAQILWGSVKTSRGSVVAACDSLGLTVEADDETELQSMIAEAQHCLFADLLEDGELHRFLQERGWALPQSLPEGGVKFDAPFRIVAQDTIEAYLLEP